MTFRRTIVVLLLAAILIGIAARLFVGASRDDARDREQRARPPARASSSNAAAPGRTVSAARILEPIPPPPPKPAPIQDAPSHLADDLNAPAGNIRRDLEILNDLFVAWQSNFPRDGNPVGENAEITAALTGKNPLGFAFVPPSHPAINPRGELCDRWGTPFRFHQLSGTEMEIRSAGPDRKFGTPDDVSK